MIHENGVPLAADRRSPESQFLLDGLKYIASCSVEEFKTLTHCEALEVAVNLHGGASYFTYGDHRGAVAAESLPCNPVVSVVVNSRGAIFALLHEAEDTGRSSFVKGGHRAEAVAAVAPASDDAAGDGDETGWSDEQVEEAFMRWRHVTEAFKKR